MQTGTAPGTRAPVSATDSWLGRMAGWSYDHRRRVLVLWIGLIVVVTGLGQVAGSRFSQNLEGGNSQSQQAQSLLTEKFPQTAGAQGYVVVDTTGPVDASSSVARMHRIVEALRTEPDVSGVVDPFSPAAHHQVSADGHIAFAIVQFDQSEATVPVSAVKAVVKKAESLAAPGFHVALGGPVIGLAVTANPGSSEGIGIVAAMMVMLIAFGSVVAMGLPILTALVGVAIGFGLEDLISHRLVVPVFSPELLAMIGLGVGIDYALFIVTRYRQGLSEGRDPRESVTVALATSGRAVLFAGITVLISLCGLFIMNLPFMRGLAVSAITAVVLVMAGSLTLLPAMLGFAGRAIDRWHLPGRLVTGAAPGPRSFWFRWSRTIQRHPWTTGIAALAALGLLIVPLFSMRLAFTDAGNDPPSLTTRQAFDQLAQGFGPGFNGPLVLAVELPAGGGTGALDGLEHAVAGTPGVAAVAPPLLNASRSTAVIIAYPTSAPQASATAQLVTHLRDSVVPAATAGSGLHVLVGGETAGGIDASAYLSSRLYWVIGAVIVLAFLLLLAVFRSIVIPVKAAVMNLLSVGAAYGATVAVFQWGWAGSVLRIGSTGPIDPWIPLMMFTVLFGLSMDYEVFLLSRIREEWRLGTDNSTAVADGLAKTARVISAAAAIMICVFGSFVIGDPLRVLKVFGFGLAASILIDATLVRLVLVPSVMELLGSANWYIPKWLDRVVPTLGAEVSVEESRAAAPPRVAVDAG